MNIRPTLIAIGLLWTYSLIAQYPIMRNYSVEDGLPGSQVYHTFEDSKGFIWISTDMGVSRFDGYEFKTFTVLDGLPSNDVWGVAEDEKGRMWLSSFNGTVYIKEDKVTEFPLPDSLKKSLSTVDHKIDIYSNHILSTLYSTYFFDQSDSLSLSLIRRDLGFDSNIAFFENQDNHRFFDLYREKAGVKDQALIYLNQEYYADTSGWFKEVLKEIKDFSNDRSIVFARFDKNKILWCDRGQVKLIDVLNQSIKELPYSCSSAAKFNEISNDLIWVKDVSSNTFLNARYEEVHEFQFLEDYQLNTINSDQNGNLWINTNNGLYFLSANSRYSQNYSLPGSTRNNEIQSMLLDPSGRLWLGSSNGNLYSFERASGVKKRANQLMTHYYKGMIIDRNGLCYLGGDYLYIIPLKDLLEDKHAVFEKDNYAVWSDSLNKRHINIKDIIQQGDSSIYFTTSLTCNQITNNKVIEYTGKKRKNNYIYALAIDDQGNIWTGKKSGIGQLTQGENQLLDHLNPLFRRPINDLQFDRQALWVATDGYGLFRYQEEQIDTIFELRDEIIKSINIDEKGRIWAATNRGIGKITIEEGTPFTYRFQRLTIAHGLNSNEVNQVLVDSTTIYIATKKGLSVLDDEKLSRYGSPPPLYFTSCSINGKDTSIFTSYDLKYNQNNININFVCLSFESQGNITYQYKMEGVDKEWKTTRSRRKEYPLLPPGEYTFLLNAMDINGHKAKGPVSIQFIISPPWWETLLFKVLAFLTLVVIGVGLAQYRIFQVRKKIAEKAEIEKKFAELELKALQAQMNPHFVFNALHSIQDFIFNKDERIANAYLVKFSRLMRLFLESSKEKTILLEDEIKLLQLYIDLEKLRFEEKFEYRLEIDPQIEPKLIEIPSMLFQPFVENAINHGLIYKESKGLLKVHIKKAQNCIQGIIEDNGIGRVKAAELKSKSYKSYKSRGMKLVEERQRVLNFINESDIRIEIIDLENEDGQAAGTQVIINIPFFD